MKYKNNKSSLKYIFYIKIDYIDNVHSIYYILVESTSAGAVPVIRLWESLITVHIVVLPVRSYGR